VTQHADQLREAFENHENLAPDPGAVYSRVQELSRKYKRRRRGVQAAGVGVLGAGLIAGAINLPSFLPGNTTSATGIGAGAAPAPSVAASYSTADLTKDFAAYYSAGYGYNDALRLAAIWHTKASIANVKAEAGRRLLAGETLPITPTPDPTTPTPSPSEVAAYQAAWNAFFHAGYVWDDAVRLAKLWHLSDPTDAKIKAGKKIEAHQPLPFQPKVVNIKAAKEQAAVEKFFNAGYNMPQAEKLAKIWHVTAYQAKVKGGELLLAGKTLPVQP
jgi:hypothetical protein